MLKHVAAAAVACSLFFSAAFPVFAEEQQVLFPVSEQTWQYLDHNSPGQNSITVYSLGARQIRDDARDSLTAELNKAMQANFSSAERLEQVILSLIKLGENPANYKNKDLVALLSSHEDPYETGLNSACGALTVYDAAHAAIPETARNSPTSLVDYIVSSQHRTGGFAPTTGRSPDALSTATVITALSPYKSTPYVDSALNKALDWLGGQQSADGSFPADKPDCVTTAAVLTALSAIGIPPGDSRFVKDGNTLLDALDRFQNTDGGFAKTVGDDSSVDATERAVIALYSNAFGLAPYLSPDSYPNYVKPEPDGIAVYLRFIFGFLGMFGIVYLLLLLTNLIGKKWGKIPPAENQKPSGAGGIENNRKTMELHIPMKAEMTEFESIYEEENHKQNKKNPAE